MAVGDALIEMGIVKAWGFCYPLLRPDLVHIPGALWDETAKTLSVTQLSPKLAWGYIPQH